MENFKFKKKYGQNFLQDKNVLETIYKSVNVLDNDLIIEIGPGHGALTNYLVNYGCDVVAFEIDKEVEPFLNKINSDKLRVIYQDFMSVDFNNYDLSKYNNIHIIANIPYYITTPILEKIIKDGINEKDLTLMVQREVADRFSAKPGDRDYGSITVFLNYYYNIKKIIDVPRKCFYPVPNVDSAVIKLERKDNLLDVDTDKFFKFVRECFQFKRKNINNNLKKYDKNIISNVLKLYNHDLNSRAEEFSLDEIYDLYKNLVK